MVASRPVATAREFLQLVAKDWKTVRSRFVKGCGEWLRDGVLFQRR
jgi:hypothetical protein